MKRFPFSPQGMALILLSICAGPEISSAQTTFERTYGGLVSDGYSTQQTSDGGYIIAGTIFADDYDIYIIKTNASGDTVWTRKYGGYGPDIVGSVQQTSDGGYIIAGTNGYNPLAGPGDMYLVKIDSNGETVWARTYSYARWDYGYSAQQTSDGGYFVAGRSEWFGVCLIKTNSSGDSLWGKAYGHTNDYGWISAQQTSDDGYIIIGRTILIKTDSSGDTLWTRPYGGAWVQQTSDEGYVIVGTTQLATGNQDIYLLKTNSSGDTLWTRTYSCTARDQGYSVQQTSDSGYIIAGYLSLMKTDSSGDTLWTRAYNGILRSVRQTLDGGYIIAGSSTSSYGADHGIYLVRTRADGLLDAPDPPMLSQPYNGAKGLSTSPTLGWLWCPRAHNYRVQVASDSLFTELIVDDSTIDSLTKVVSGLPYNTQLYWRLNASNQTGTSEYSAVWMFTTAVTPPMLVAPLNSATNQSTTLTLVWNRSAGASQYRLQLGVDSTFSQGLFLDDSTLVDTSRIVSGLAMNTRYFWRARATDGETSSTWSQVWRFDTKLDLPEAVILVSPEDKATVNKDSVRFIWRPGAPIVQRYAWELAADSLFGSSVVDSLIADTSKVLSALPGGQTFWWRVAAQNASGWGQFSQSNRFTTRLTNVSEQWGIPHEFSLGQNYPNPFNPSTTIRYGLAQRSRVTLTIFNVLGQQVAQLVNEEVGAGCHDVKLDGRGLANGVYLCRMQAGGFVQVKRLLLLR